MRFAISHLKFGRWSVGLLLYCGVLSGTTVLHAQTLFIPTSVFQQVGTTRLTHEITTGATWGWDRQWTFGGGRLSGYWEASVSEWSYIAVDGRTNAQLGQIGLVPVFRFRPADGQSRWFFEGAVGINVMTSLYQTDRKRFSTKVNFGDHLALGFNFGKHRQHEMSLRLEHFSNAGMRSPNPGENFLQFRYAYHFGE
jgi:lipid A 3-O-deacylase